MGYLKSDQTSQQILAFIEHPFTFTVHIYGIRVITSCLSGIENSRFIGETHPHHLPDYSGLASEKISLLLSHVVTIGNSRQIIHIYSRFLQDRT